MDTAYFMHLRNQARNAPEEDVSREEFIRRMIASGQTPEKAASWVYQGQSKENRSYADATGQRFARRKFHSGDRNFSEAEIKAMGYTRVKLPGKHRYAKGLTNQARKDVAASAKPYLKPTHATAP